MIANSVFNPFTNDSRVIKESTSLAGSSAYNVEVIAHLDKNLDKTQIQNNFMVKRFSYLYRTITKSKVSKLKAYLIYVKETYNREEQEKVLVDIYKELNLCD